MEKRYYIDTDYKFDVNKLRSALSEISSITKTENAGLNDESFAAISLTQIPGDSDSTKGSKARGIFWTKPDESGVEVQRDVLIDETKYTEFVETFKNTYLKDVYDQLSKKYRLGRCRLLWKKPRTTLSWHRDPEPRLHIPIITNPGSIMVIEEHAFHMPADGSVWITDNTKYHNFFNGGEEERIHFVASVVDCNMKIFH
tara:strand:- start:244 stop:840 length:597 start_codon:yes stop_codon:yes gene_type:complete